MSPRVRPPAQKLFHDRGWHRSGASRRGLQLLLAGAILGVLVPRHDRWRPGAGRRASAPLPEISGVPQGPARLSWYARESDRGKVALLPARLKLLSWRSWRRVPRPTQTLSASRASSSRQPLLPNREVVNPTATRVVLTLICSIAAVAGTASAAPSPTCLGYKATIVGTNAADNLVGTAAP